MPGTGFGFPSYPQRPSLNPQDVGALLMQQNTQPAPAPAAPLAAPEMPGRALSDLTADDTPIGGDDAVPSALHIAARELTARGPATTIGTQRQPASPGSFAQLSKLGLSPEEIQFITIGGSMV